jgi:hypothetical protein
MHRKPKIVSYYIDIKRINQDNMSFPGEIFSVFLRMCMARLLLSLLGKVKLRAAMPLHRMAPP